MSRAGIGEPNVAFEHLMATLRPSLKLQDYFVNWDKVFANTREVEMHLNLWNFLLGKDDFDSEFDALLTAHPQIVQALPTMVVRDGKGSRQFDIVENIHDLTAQELHFDFSQNANTPELREAALDFVKKSGLIRLFAKNGVKNLVDYVLGVEAGIDSNGRKNRGGTAMETVVEQYLIGFKKVRPVDFISQATPAAIASKWGFNVPQDKAGRRYDFAVSDGETLVLMEVNFYGGGGSKLKATAQEYVQLNETIGDDEARFIWVTDGAGWVTTKGPLRNAFDKIDHIWNLSWLAQGFLEDLFPAKQ